MIKYQNARDVEDYKLNWISIFLVEKMFAIVLEMMRA
jgi:hypothetical protein